MPRTRLKRPDLLPTDTRPAPAPAAAAAPAPASAPAAPRRARAPEVKHGVPAAPVPLPVRPAVAQDAEAASALVKAAKSTKTAKPEKPAKMEKPAKLRKALVRDGFTMPETDFALIAALKERAVGAGRPAKKSELLRAGLQALAALDAKKLRAALERLEPIKVGRPKQD